jgi:hypothetical protein
VLGQWSGFGIRVGKANIYPNQILVPRNLSKSAHKYLIILRNSARWPRTILSAEDRGNKPK